VFEFPWKLTHTQFDEYPWTMAIVGGIYYFSHPAADIIYFDTFTHSWGIYPLDPNCFTRPVVGLAESGNRLVMLLKDTVNWSELDNGFNIDCDIYSGAGFQHLDRITAGTALGVVPTRSGFMTFTSRGTMNSTELSPKNTGLRMHLDTGLESDKNSSSKESTAAGLFDTLRDSADPQYNHSWQNKDIIPLNPHCFVQLPNFQTLILTKRGFFIINEKQVADEIETSDWQTMFGKYLSDQEWCPRVYTRKVEENTFRTHFRAVRLSDFAHIKLEYNWQFGELWVSFRYGNDKFHRKALVYQFDFDKWCSFDQNHYCVGDMHLDRMPYMHKKSYGFLNEFGGFQEFNSAGWINLATLSTNNILGCNLDKTHLNSFVEIGTFRRNNFKTHDMLTRVTDVTLGHGSSSGDIELTFDTHNGELIDNWEEQGYIEQATKFQSSLVGTYDGYNQFHDQWEALSCFKTTGHKSYYSTNNSAQAHSVIIYTNNVDDFYQISTIHVVGRSAGRL
jgi:hypothetical protein